MIWSKYNFLFESAKHGLFIYNSSTNAFLKLNSELFDICRKIKTDINKIELLDSNIKNEFQQAKILVSQYEDESYFTKTKYLKHLRSFSQTGLGLVIAPTYSCNFACPYCYENNLPDIHMKEETEDHIIEFVKLYSDSKDLVLCWHGGEPLLRFSNMKSLLNKIQKDDAINLTEHHLVTNGYLLDKEKLDFLKNHNLKSVQITIDGLPETHNKSRKHKSGEPTYDTIIKNIDYLIESCPDCLANIRVNIHNENKEEFHILYKELKKRWPGKNVNIHFMYAEDHGTCQVACLENKNKLGFIIDLYKKYGIQEVDFYPKTKLGGCTADSNSSFVIGPKGEMYKCWVDLGKKEREIGSVTKQDLNLELISEYVSGTDKFNDAKCKDCFLFPVCDGGCGMFRLEKKQTGKEYNVCPINPEDLNLLLEIFYEKQLKE